MLSNKHEKPSINFAGKIVLITGGTRGIGLATSLAFAKYGAQCVSTYHWGDHDQESILQAHKAIGSNKPILFQADVSNTQDTDQLLAKINKIGSQVDVFVSNAAMAPVIGSFEDYSLKRLQKALSYSTWPMIDYMQKMQKLFGRLPSYIIAVSSTGPDHYSYGYDFVSAAKAATECMCRYLSYRFREEPININAVRSRAIKTQSLEDTFGKELEPFVKKFVPDNYWIHPDEVANTIVSLCSGYCDTINGQTITVDRGTSFFDNFMDIYTRYRKGDLAI